MYKIKSNSKGLAKLVIKKKVIQKLKKGKKYRVKIEYKNETVYSYVKIKR